MTDPALRLYREPRLENATLLIGFSGWMDGGDVSTGTIEYLVEKLEAEQFGDIQPEDFYIYSFPGSMDVAALIRPHTLISDGLIEDYLPPENNLYVAPEHNLLLLEGSEPNFAWKRFSDLLFSICHQFNVCTIYFVGSVGGTTPHTREPRIAFSASHRKLRDELKALGLRPTNYEGPASFITGLTARATEEGVQMASLVVEIPSYVQGFNPRAIETMTKLVARLLKLSVPLQELHASAAEHEEKISEAVENEPELAEQVKQLEMDYDKEAFERDIGDLEEQDTP